VKDVEFSLIRRIYQTRRGACLSSIFGFVILVQKFDMSFDYWLRIDVFSEINSKVTRVRYLSPKGGSKPKFGLQSVNLSLQSSDTSLLFLRNTIYVGRKTHRYRLTFVDVVACMLNLFGKKASPSAA